MREMLSSAIFSTSQNLLNTLDMIEDDAVLEVPETYFRNCLMASVNLIQMGHVLTFLENRSEFTDFEGEFHLFVAANTYNDLTDLGYDRVWAWDVSGIEKSISSRESYPVRGSSDPMRVSPGDFGDFLEETPEDSLDDPLEFVGMVLPNNFALTLDGELKKFKHFTAMTRDEAMKHLDRAEF